MASTVNKHNYLNVIADCRGMKNGRQKLKSKIEYDTQKRDNFRLNRKLRKNVMKTILVGQLSCALIQMQHSIEQANGYGHGQHWQ